MRPDERLGLAIEVLGAHAGLHDPVHERERLVDDPAGVGHRLELAIRLDRDHARPSARSARCATSVTGPTASMRVTPPCCSYQATTGAVCTRYASRRVATAAGS